MNFPLLCGAIMIVGSCTQRPKVPGLSFTIKIERCYGYADKDAGELMNPGNRFRIGFDLLGRVIEKVTGMKYEEYVHGIVLQP